MEEITITVDGHQITANPGQSVLDAALKADIYIPHLCHHEDLPDIGACGLCIVDIEGETEIQKSCMMQVRDGMKVHTKSEKLNQRRRLAMELMLANHIDDCTTCPKYLKCELQSLIQYLGVSTSRLKRTLISVPENRENPLIIRDMDRCVSCGRCVRVCKDIRGVHALDYEMTEDDRVKVGIIHNGTLKEELCRFCGSCIEVCPTGALRDQEGIIRSDLNRELALIPCKAECPAHIDVPKYVRSIKEGKYQDAIAVIREKAPFPQSLGYVCMAFCEGKCRRKELNGSLSIRELKKFAAAKDDGSWKKKTVKKGPTNKKAAVIGSGPAGLTAAYYLAKQGHQVTVFEKLPTAGGMLTTGIPAYRLDRDIVAEEIENIREAGVEIRTNTAIESIDELKDYDAVLLTPGTGKGVRLPIDGAGLEGVYENIDFLHRVSLGEEVQPGDRVVVLGGGNVAFDCARTAKRLGAKKVILTCLEDRAHMTSSEDEITEGEEDGVEVINSRTFLSIEGDSGKVTGVVCEEVESFSFDPKNGLQLKVKEGSKHVIPADTVIFATGQRPEIPEGWKVETGRGNLIIAEESGRIPGTNIFAAGDAVTGTHSVIRAIAGGRKAAEEMDCFLGGNGNIEEKLSQDVTPGGYMGSDEEFLGLERQTTHTCFLDDEAKKEADRCLQCDLRLQLTKPKMWTSYQVK